MGDCRFVHIVHRDVDVRDALEGLMTSEGFGVQNHFSVQCFFETVRQQDQGCLILDVDMPEMSSTDFLAKMVEQSVDLKIVAVRANADARPVDCEMAAAATAFFEVPGDLDKAVSTVVAIMTLKDGD